MRKRTIIITILLIIAALLFAGCKSGSENNGIPENNSSPPNTTQIKKINETEKPTEPPTEPLTEAPTQPSFEMLVKEKYQKLLSGTAKDKAELDNINALNQLDGMEAGCEAMALTAAINHFSYDLGMDDIVDDYLVYCDDEFVTGYCGDPHYFYDGAGIFPPGIVTTALNFVNDKKVGFYPIDTTGLSMDQLYLLIDAGCPVLIWTTFDRNYPDVDYTLEYGGIEYPWYDTEHCVCLFGYDRAAGTVSVADSWGGWEDRESAEIFEDLYDEIGRFSVALMPTDDLKQGG